MTQLDQKIKTEDRTFGFFIDGMLAVWELLGDYKKKMLTVIAWIIFIEFFHVLLPFLAKLITDEIPTIINQKEFNGYFIYLIFTMLAIGIFSSYLHHFSLERNFLKYLTELDRIWPVKAQKKLLELSVNFHEKENTGKKIAKIQKGCDRLCGILEKLRWGVMPTLVYLIINTIFTLIIDWRIGLLFFIPLIPAFLVVYYGLKKAEIIWESCEKNWEIASGLFCQSVLCVQTVQNYVQEKKELHNCSEKRTKAERLDIEACFLLERYAFFMDAILKTFYVLTIFVSIYFAVHGEITIGTIVFIIATGSVTSGAIWQLAQEYMGISKYLVSVMRVKRLLDEKSEIKNSPNAITPDEFKGKLKIKNVKYSYPDKKHSVLKGINIEINPGEMVAFIGKSGEGKTTVVKLICRMMDINSGEITLDKVNIHNIDISWYRKNFAIVSQDIDIFDDTLFNNIRYGCPTASEAQVKEALRAAHLHVILDNKDRFPKGINEQVGERGVKLSGGEKQRVGIARAYLALLNGARVLVLDEATSSLDSEAERAIQEMINKLREANNISIIAIAHRLSTIQRSDMIYVINGGKVVEKANHEELMKKKGIYSELVNLQKIRD